eukprot:4799555-Pleurochrysis_carterae.AAC.1
MADAFHTAVSQLHALAALAADAGQADDADPHPDADADADAGADADADADGRDSDGHSDGDDGDDRDDGACGALPLVSDEANEALVHGLVSLLRSLALNDAELREQGAPLLCPLVFHRLLFPPMRILQRSETGGQEGQEGQEGQKGRGQQKGRKARESGG